MYLQLLSSALSLFLRHFPLCRCFEDNADLTFGGQIRISERTGEIFRI